MRVSNINKDNKIKSQSFLEDELSSFEEKGLEVNPKGKEPKSPEARKSVPKSIGQKPNNSEVKKKSSTSKSTNQKSKKSTKTSNTKNRNKKGKKQKKEKDYGTLGKLKAGRIVGAVFMGIFFSTVITGIVYAEYMNYIKYPKQMEVVNEKTGTYCIHNWEQNIYSLKSLGKDSYLPQEITYANDDKDKIAFLKKVAKTVAYIPKQVEAKNVYGNTMIDRKTDEIVYTDSTLNIGEEVTLSYIDYSRVRVNKKVVTELMEEADLKLGDVDYTNKLVDVFCKYMSSLEEDKIPLKKEKHIPNMILNKDGSYSITSEEDIFIDKLLYSSDDLYDLMERFSVVAGSVGVVNPEWEEWNKLSDKDKKDKKKHKEPSKELSELQPTKEWQEWDALEYKERKDKEEPVKYNWKDIMNKLWCGSYYLQNEYTQVDENGNVVKTKISAEVGDGTLKDPAGLKTDVLTSVFIEEKDKDGKMVDKEYPIKIRMVEYGVSEDAIKWFESKDEQNRGIDIESEVQYCYYVFEITNMSDKELTISDNSVLCDSNANVASRTGTMYNLKDTVTLKPDETGRIETWGRSTELNKRYVIWGKDFARRAEPVWFRVLAGNIDDPSEEKGVHLNKTRHGDESNEGVDSESTEE